MTPTLNASGLLSAGNAAKDAKDLARVPPSYPPHALIYVFGYYNNQLAHRLQAVCGEQPPTITGGWPNITSVTRPRSEDYVVLTDYPPLTMDVSLRFDGWLSPPVNPDVEHDMQKLTWMWGRGTLGPGQPGVGNPPILKLGAFNGGQTQTPLIPPDVQDLEWVITNVQYDTAPLRFNAAQLAARGLSLPVASRARQDVVISLMRWQPAPGFQVQKAKAPDGVVYLKSTQKANCVRSMCQICYDRHQTSDYRTVMNLSANAHLNLRNPGQILPVQTRVAFPATFKNSGR